MTHREKFRCDSAHTRICSQTEENIPLRCLDYYADAERYDAEYAPFGLDRDWYVLRAREAGGPVLELGCGTGRILLSLAGWGMEVCGIDAGPEMLDRARTRALAMGLAARVELHEARMADFSLNRKFGCVIAPLNALMHHLDDKTFSACLRRVAHHLRPDGRFLFDLSMPRPEFIAEASVPQGVEVRSFRLRDKIWRQRERHRFDMASRISRVRFEFIPEASPEEAYACELDMRFYGPDDWPPLFQAAGLRILQVYGDFQSTPFDATEAVVQVGVAGLEL